MPVSGVFTGNAAEGVMHKAKEAHRRLLISTFPRAQYLKQNFAIVPRKFGPLWI